MTLSRSRILTAVPRTWDTHLEIAKALRVLAGQHNEQQQRPQRQTEIASPPDIRELAAEIIREIFFELRKASFNPDEPRVLAGNPDGGQWTKDGGNGISTNSPDDAGDETSGSPALAGTQYAELGIRTLTDATESGSQTVLSNDVRIAMEGNDPVTGVPMRFETPINRFGGGGGGGFGEQSSVGSSEAATADVQSLGPPQVGSFSVPENLTFGTTLFGSYAHRATAELLQGLHPDVPFEFNVLPGQRGIDVTVPAHSVDKIGYEFGEIKPLTSSGEAAFNRQLLQWGIGPVQPITYDAAGNVYYGFRR